MTVIPKSAVLRRRTPTSAVSRRLLTAVAALVVVSLVSAGCSDGLRDRQSSASARNASAATSGSDVGLLFSVLAPTMDVAVEGSGFRLTIAADSPTAWFTDRPVRRAGSFTAADLVSIWSAEKFDVDPPNAALVLVVDGETRQHVVELSDARVTGAKVSFHSEDVGNDPSTDPVANRAATHDVAVGSFTNAELFIDDGDGPPCASSITDLNFDPCLIPAHGKVSFKATTTSPEQYAQISKPEPTDPNSNGSFTVAATKTTSQDYIPWGPCSNPCISAYSSGQTWTVTAGSVAVNFTVGFLPGPSGGGGGDGYDGGWDDD